MSRTHHGHGHAHSLSDISHTLSPIARWFVIGTLAVTAVAVAVGMVVLWPSDSEHPIPTQFRSADGGPITTVDGEIVDQFHANCLNSVAGSVLETADIPVNPVPGGPCILNAVRFTSGDVAGQYTVLEIPTNRAQADPGPTPWPPPPARSTTPRPASRR